MNTNQQWMALESVIDALIKNDDAKFFTLMQLLTFINEHKIDLEDVQTILALSYTDFKQGQIDTENTHL